MDGATRFPELVIGIAGPIGVDVDAISASVDNALRDVGYKSKVLKLTKAMMAYPTRVGRLDDEEDFAKLMNFKIDYADALCIENADLAIMSRIALKAIREIRREITEDPEIPSPRTAYIIRQFKRPDEIRLMRSVYGKQFVLVSAYGSLEDRNAILVDRQRRSSSTLNRESDHACAIDKLIERDASETAMFGGQQLRDTFHLADVFIDGIARRKWTPSLSDSFEHFSV